MNQATAATGFWVSARRRVGRAAAVAALGLTATLGGPSASAAEENAGGAALVEATGLDLMLNAVEEGVRLQLMESGGGLSIEDANYASKAFDGAALTESVADELDRALPATVRAEVRDYYASPIGAKLSGMEREINRQLQSLTNDLSTTILSEGEKLQNEEERGAVVEALRVDGGSRDVSERILEATTYALLLGAGDLREVQDQTVIDAKVASELDPIWDLIRDFDDLAYAYGFREASVEELKDLDAFLRSESGAAFIAALKTAVDNTLDAASKDLELRLRTGPKKTKT